MRQDFINKTQNGQIFKCDKCNAIHIEYKNLNFNLSDEQFEHFSEYITKLDGKKWEEKNKNTLFKRKIIIPIGHQSFRVLLNIKELEELKRLFSTKKQKPNLVQNYKTMNLSFTFNLN